MLKNFLKDNIESRDPAVRRAAIEKLEDNESTQKKCLQLVRTDEDLGVRIAAVKRATDAPALLKMQLGKSGESPVLPPELSSAITSRLEELVTDGNVLSRAQMDALILTPGGAGPMLVCCYCPDATLRTAALEKIQQQADLSRVVVGTRFHITREQAALRLDVVEEMESTAAEIKSRDKVVARALQDRVDTIRQKEKQVADHLATIEQLIQSCASLASSVWSPQYTGRFTALVEKWDRLTPAPNEAQNQRFETSRAVCQALVTEHQQQSQALRYCEEATVQMESLVAALLAEPLDALTTKVGQYRADISSARGSWRISQEAAEPSAALTKQFDSADTDATTLLSDTEKSLAARALPNDRADLESLQKNLALIDKILKGELASKQSASALYT
ncbi:MAG: hypothetical protein KTR33_16870, partial [Gammaproteobacteria bacterium]|nr:hypothetical protein [Gammaproteobacteria bacterium]